MNDLKPWLARSLLLGFFLMSFALATTYEALTLEEMIDKAERAFFGAVTEVSNVVEDGEPWTEVTFEVSEALKLPTDTETVTLAFYGGMVGDTRVSVNLMPSFEVGEEVLIFYYSNRYYSPIVGFRQALWRQSDLGFVNPNGQLLSLGEEGELLLSGAGAATEDLIEALKTAFEVTP